MKILFVSQWYSPEPDGRVSALAEGLVSLGHEVMVITGFPNYPKGDIYPGYKIKWRQWEKLNGISVLRLPLYPDHSHSVIKRAFNYISFNLSLFLIAPWFINKPDVIWSYTPFMSLPTLWFHKIFKVPYVMEIADVWPDTITSTGMMEKGVAVNILSFVAQLAYKNAAAITVQNHGFKPCLIERGAEPEKIKIIENWADEKLYHPLDYNVELAKEYNMDNKFNVMFAGNMGLAQGLDNVITAAKYCEKEKKIQFIFIGDGGCLNNIKLRVKKEKIDNVLFISRKPAEEMAGFFAIADILLVSLKDDPVFEITLPAKTQSYLACGRPIIIVKRGEDAKMLEEEGAALMCEPDNPEILAGVVMRFFNLESEMQNKMGQAGLKLYKEKFTKEKLLKKMEEVLQSAI